MESRVRLETLLASSLSMLSNLSPFVSVLEGRIQRHRCAQYALNLFTSTLRTSVPSGANGSARDSVDLRRCRNLVIHRLFLPEVEMIGASTNAVAVAPSVHVFFHL